MRISIHALREEGDDEAKSVVKANEEFLSTPSARRATNLNDGEIYEMEFLSTPSARRATMEQTRRRINNGISIHALREEGDYSSLMCVSV